MSNLTTVRKYITKRKITCNFVTKEKKMKNECFRFNKPHLKMGGRKLNKKHFIKGKQTNKQKKAFQLFKSNFENDVQYQIFFLFPDYNGQHTKHKR